MKTAWFRQPWWRPVLWLGAYVALASPLLLWRLGALVPAHASEVAACHQTQHAIFYGLLTYLSPYNCSPQHTVWLRLPAVLCALLAGGLFMWAVKLWLGRRAALFSAVLYLSSSWFLHNGRLALPGVSLLLIVPLCLWLYKYAGQHSTARRTGFLAVASFAVLASLSGGLLFALLLVALANKQIVSYIKQRAWWLVALQAVCLLLLLSPLLWQLLHHHSRGDLEAWSGLIPAGGISIVHYVQRLAYVPIQLFYHGPQQPIIWLGRLPVLDFFVSVLTVIGAVWLVWHTHVLRRWLLLSCLVLGILTANLSSYGAAGLSIIVPLAYFAAAAGIQFLLKRWLGVFPRNPFARSLAYGLIGLVVLAAVAYNTRAYFVAWPHNLQTKHEFAIIDR